MKSKADATVDKDGIINLKVGDSPMRSSKQGSSSGKNSRPRTAGLTRESKKKSNKKEGKASRRCSMCSSAVISEKNKKSVGRKSA